MSKHPPATDATQENSPPSDLALPPIDASPDEISQALSRLEPPEEPDRDPV